MFTSRAEYRLLFNHGSAELRLLDYAARFGLVSPRRIELMRQKKASVEKAKKWMEANRNGEQSWATLVRRNETALTLPQEVGSLPREVLDQTLYEIKYDGYLQRELRQIEKLSNVESVRIPDNFEFLTVKGLKRESALKLNELRPANLGQASRVSGVNPTDISILLVALSAN